MRRKCERKCFKNHENVVEWTPRERERKETNGKAERKKKHQKFSVMNWTHIADIMLRPQKELHFQTIIYHILGVRLGKS